MTEPLVDPERELALSYASPPVRPHLRALWLLDERFGAIISGTTEATIGEMRLLWWREAIATSTEEGRVEPLLGHIAEVLGAIKSDPAEWGAMAEGWHALLQEPIAEAELERFAKQRGGRLFALSAEILDRDVPWISNAGCSWALADLSHRIRDPETAEKARTMAQQCITELGDVIWPRPLRPLGALAALARRDVKTLQRRQGSPGRVARMMWHRFTGR